MASKLYILDTSTIIYHPQCFKSFKNNTVILPIPVLEELDKLKSYANETGKNARFFLRTLDQIIKGSEEHIHIGINTDDVVLKIDVNIVFNETLGSPLYGDNRILSYAIQLAKSKPRSKVILVSKDIGLRVRANSYGIVAEDYIKDNYAGAEKPDNHRDITLSDEEINDFYKAGSLEIPDETIEALSLKANMFVSLKDELGEIVGQSRFIKQKKSLRALNQAKNVFGLHARNLEQQYALDLLLDNEVKLVTLAGPAGSGKTLASIAAGLHCVMEAGKSYEKLMIMKPTQAMGKDIGYLPGSKEEKLSPYLASYYDNINFLMRSSKNGKASASKQMDPYLSMMMENGTIEMEALTYLRGRSLSNCFIIVDEIQNISIHELKTILTRIGEGAKMVLIGDETQIDNMSLSAGSNALATVLNKFVDYPIAGSVFLSRGERSALATLASQIL